MKFWDFQKHVYRPGAPNRIFVKATEGGGEYHDLPPDVFLDGMGRLWYADTDELRAALPAEPEQLPKIPPEFWHTDFARKLSHRQHIERKHELEDERIEGRRPQLV